MTVRIEAERPSDFARQALDVLARYVSPPTARSVLDLAVRRSALSISAFGREHLGRVVNNVRDGVALFVSSPEKISDCVAALERLGGDPIDHEADAADVIEVTVRVEDDIVRARSEARSISQRAGFSELARTRVATAVSELARNIVRYAGNGTITLARVAGANGRARIEIVAADRGPGIADVDAVLGGTYRSQHGMGLGLRGVKRIAEQFEIQTAPRRGTTVRARIGGE